MAEPSKTQMFKERAGIFGAGVFVGVALVVCFLLLIALLPQRNMTAASPPPMRGMFFGQVVDALSFEPIPNATLYICDDSHFSSLVTVVSTNSSGFYNTVNIALSTAFRIEAKAKGYYDLPLAYSGFHTDEAGNATYYIEPVPLYRISTNFGIQMEFYGDANHQMPFILPEDSNETLVLDSNNARIDLDYVFRVFNNEALTSLGAPGYDNAVLFATTAYGGDLGSVKIYPDLQFSVQSVIRDNSHFPLESVTGSISFQAKGLFWFGLSLNTWRRDNPTLVCAHRNIGFYVLVR